MDFVEKLEYLDWLISRGASGTAEELAKKLRVSPRSIFNYIRWMKERGAPIEFSKQRNSYFYTRNVKFIVTFQSKDKPE